MTNEREHTDGDKIDRAKRETLRRMVASTAFVVPVIASFPISGLTIDKAMAQSHGVHSFSNGFFRAPS